MNTNSTETYYDGNHFRSVLEARWAVFFNYIGMPFRYVERGYEVNSVQYSPYFIAPTVSPNEESGTWEPSERWFLLQAQLSEPTETELEQVALLCAEVDHPIVILAGDTSPNYKGYMLKKLDAAKFIGKEHELNIVLRKNDYWIVCTELPGDLMEKFFSMLSYGGLLRHEEIFDDYEEAYRVSCKMRFDLKKETNDSDGPIKKYFSEFGLNMFGVYRVLLQQDQLHRLEDDELGSKYPCHIYMVTRRPRIMLDPESIAFTDESVSGIFNIQRGNKQEPHPFKVPNNLGTSKARIECSFPYTEYVIFDERDEILSSGKSALLITSFGDFWEFLPLEVLYIGQSYGVEGARTAPERLRNHSTLQGIYVEAMRRTPDQEIWLLLWSFEPLLFASFDGTQDSYGTTHEEDDLHIKQVIRTGITEQQQINFTEAALIRYFEPEYNKIFKDSFPNPAHKTYSECYDLDINSVAVELQTEDIMCQLWSPKVAPQWIHIAQYFLHSNEERKSMLDFY